LHTCPSIAFKSSYSINLNNIKLLVIIMNNSIIFYIMYIYIKHLQKYLKI